MVRLREEVNAAHRAAYRRYTGGRMRHDITLVLSADSITLEDKEWFGRWAELTDGQVTIRVVNGTHANLFVQPYVRELAAEISTTLGSESGDARALTRVAPVIRPPTDRGGRRPRCVQRKHSVRESDRPSSTWSARGDSNCRPPVPKVRRTGVGAPHGQRVQAVENVDSIGQ